MQRKKWFELHDHELFPGFLRNLVTDALEAIWNQTHVYRVIVPRLQAAMKQVRTRQIIDLCSGGGGPWMRLREEFRRQGFSVSISLTDKFPNVQASDRMPSGIEFHTLPVDATLIPENLEGFRTIFSSFHHFDPDAARAILADAVKKQRGIAIFEAARKDAFTIVATAAVPILCLWVTPRIRPFRWSRLLWTYLLPVIPLTLLVDGVLSCFRSYSLDDLHELTDGLGGEGYCWEIGEERGARVGITYLIGFPQVRAGIEQPGVVVSAM
jgi:hypothetical protein